MALFRNQPIWDLARQLQLTLHNQPLSVPSAAVAGRQRLGEEPLAHLFRLLCQGWTTGECVCQHVLGLRLQAFDGVVWAIPDTPQTTAWPWAAAINMARVGGLQFEQSA